MGRKKKLQDVTISVYQLTCLFAKLLQPFSVICSSLCSTISDFLCQSIFVQKNFTKDQYNTIPQHMLESKANKYTASWRTFGVYHPRQARLESTIQNNDKGKDKQLATEHNWREEYATLPFFSSVFFFPSHP